MGLSEINAANESPAPKKRRKKPFSPSAHALKECRKRGWIAQVVERWNKFAGIKQDLFGVIDIVVITPDGILGIQATSGDHHANRRAKIYQEPRALAWIAAGAQLAVWSYALRGSAGKRKLYTLREEMILASDFAENPATEAA